MLRSLNKVLAIVRAGFWAWLLIALVLGMQHLAGWVSVQMARIDKESELENHLADLGRLAPVLLGRPALALADLALDASLEASGAQAGEPDPITFAEGLDEGLTEPFKRFALEARLERVVLLDEAGRILLDTAEPERHLVPYEYWEVDRLEVHDALMGQPASVPAFSSALEASKRHYQPLGERMGEESPMRVRAILCLVAGRTYLSGIERLSQRIRQTNVVLACLMTLIAMVVWHLIRRQREIERQAAEADRLAGLGQLAAGFAHELRNPLEIVRAFTEDLERGLATGGDPEEAIDACRDIIEEVDRMNRLVGQFLAYSRGQAAAGGEPAEAPVAATLQSVIGMLRVSAEKRRVRLGVESAAGLDPAELERWVVGLEAGQLKQVLINLILNAIQASPEGGRVTVLLSAGTRQVELRVSDQGAGVAEKERHRIFEPFYTTRAGGSGLGLAVSRQIVMGAGGALKLAPRRKKETGACFIVTLPRLKDAEPGAGGRRGGAGREPNEPAGAGSGPATPLGGEPGQA